MTTPSLIAFIPARGGSKGVLRKNMALLNGRPLLAYTLSVAQDAKVFDQIVISTDDQEIATYARDAGCIVHHRPAHLATDSSRVVDAVEDASASLSWPSEAVITVMQPTSPLREISDVRKAMELHLQGGGSPVVSVVECEHHPLKVVRVENGRILTGADHSLIEASRQDLPQFFRPNGAIYLCPLSIILQSHSLVPADALASTMSRESSIDIDDNLDLQLATLILQHRHRRIFT